MFVWVLSFGYVWHGAPSPHWLWDSWDLVQSKYADSLVENFFLNFKKVTVEPRALLSIRLVTQKLAP